MTGDQVTTFVLAAALVLSAACGHRASPGADIVTTPQGEGAAGGDPAAEPTTAATGPDAETLDGVVIRSPPPAARIVERWACSRVVHPLVDYHQATLELREDQSYELHHTHTTPEWGWTSWVLGRWARAGGVVTLTPVSAVRRAWIGDGHRHQHGEDVPYDEWEEIVTVDPWRLEPRTDPEHGAALRVTEISTNVYRVAESVEPPPCDPGLPPRRTKAAARPGPK
jgi:hypothetical protein